MTTELKGKAFRSMRLSEVTAYADRMSQRLERDMVVVSDGLTYVPVSLRSWQLFGKNFAPHWRAELLVRAGDGSGVFTVAAYSEALVTKLEQQ